MKRYEGLFILDLAGKEDGVNEAVDKVKAIMTEAGAKVETVQKMEKKTFARITDKAKPGGFYVNVIFEIEPAQVAALKGKFRLVNEVYRVSISHAVAPAPAK